MLGARRAEPGAWPLHARIANRASPPSCGAGPALRLTDLGPMRAARREALLELGIRDRRFGWPLEMVLRAARPGGGSARSRSPTCPRVGRSKVTGHRARHGPRDRRHGAGPAMSARARRRPDRDRQGAAAGPVQDPALPAAYARTRPRSSRAAALADTLEAAARDAGAPASCWLSTAGRATGCRAGFEVVAAGRRRPRPTGSRARSRLSAARRCWSAWTRRSSPRRCSTGRCARLAGDGVDAVLGPAPDGGYWAIGLRRADAATRSRGCR